ncbi:FUSC family protein [Microlunatus sp. Y2014]|uniref:FUSC family protein n=1 Tax=Microlunatus sp. Y2014 TaxID=3418488 RepID=UPI003DA73300
MPDPADPTAVPDRSRTIAGTVLRQRRHLRFLYSMQASPPRAVIAVKAAVAMGIPLTLAVALGQEQLGFLASLGAFTILYGPATAWRRWIRMMLVVGGSLTGSALLGALTAWQPVLHLVVLVLSAMVAVFLCLALRTGPPNAFFFVLAQGVAGLAVSGGAPAVPLVLSVAGGAAIAVVVGMSDLVFDPRRPERVAIEHAGVAVDAYESARGRDDITATHHGGATALHTAWTTVADGGSHSAMVQRLASVQARYSVRLAGDTASVTNWTVALPTDEPSATMPEGSDAEDRTSALAVEAEQFRDTALGRADAGHLIRSAAHWPSEVLHAVNRVGPAALLAGAVALALANGHVYWAVAFSLLILNQGGTRLAQTHRAVQRLLGTLLGLVAYGFVLRLQPDAWVVVMVVVVLQFAVEMMVTRNYGVAVIFLTPLALTVATAAAPGVPVDTLVADRALDTVIAVASALLVLWLTGRVRPELQLRAHAPPGRPRPASRARRPRDRTGRRAGRAVPPAAAAPRAARVTNGGTTLRRRCARPGRPVPAAGTGPHSDGTPRAGSLLAPGPAPVRGTIRRGIEAAGTHHRTPRRPTPERGRAERTTPGRGSGADRCRPAIELRP